MPVVLGKLDDIIHHFIRLFSFHIILYEEKAPEFIEFPSVRQVRIRTITNVSGFALHLRIQEARYKSRHLFFFLFFPSRRNRFPCSPVREQSYVGTWNGNFIYCNSKFPSFTTLLSCSVNWRNVSSNGIINPMGKRLDVCRWLKANTCSEVFSRNYYTFLTTSIVLSRGGSNIIKATRTAHDLEETSRHSKLLTSTILLPLILVWHASLWTGQAIHFLHYGRNAHSRNWQAKKIYNRIITSLSYTADGYEEPSRDSKLRASLGSWVYGRTLAKTYNAERRMEKEEEVW